mmetsp:Transcript_29961/g.29156  ORF Transcript_29961/g.29156 Transcript_29961/m.29156 type:complete len:269 (+) Transcript_29961:430-1236(+)
MERMHASEYFYVLLGPVDALAGVLLDLSLGLFLLMEEALADEALEPPEQYSIPLLLIEIADDEGAEGSGLVADVADSDLLLLEVVEDVQEDPFHLKEAHPGVLQQEPIQESLKRELAQQFHGVEVDALLEEELAEELLGHEGVLLHLHQQVQQQVPQLLPLLHLQLHRVLATDLHHLPYDMVQLGAVEHSLLILHREPHELCGVLAEGLEDLILEHLHVDLLLQDLQVHPHALIVAPHLRIQQRAGLLLVKLLAYHQELLRGVVPLVH